MAEFGSKLQICEGVIGGVGGLEKKTCKGLFKTKDHKKKLPINKSNGNIFLVL